MTDELLNHYLEFGMYTNPGLFKDTLQKNLPDDVRKIGLLVRKQIIHRVTLANGNKGSNADLRYGDMNKVPWHRQPEDDVLVTAAAMLAELYRRDKRGFVMDRTEENKLVITCRFVAILTASILKSKGIPARVRSGFAPYFNLFGNKSADHWITQYWDKNKKQWVTIDVDGSLETLPFDPYDMPDGSFDFSADAWIHVREGKIKGNHFWNAKPKDGLVVIAWELFYDFHCLMNSEIIYLHTPSLVLLHNFDKVSEGELKEIDNIALLMQKPDENFHELKTIWNTNKKYRLLKGGLL